MDGNDAVNALEARRRLLRTLAAGTTAGAATMIPGRWARPVVASVILPAHAQTSAPVEPAPSPSPGPTEYSLSVDSVGADSVIQVSCAGAGAAARLQLRFSVNGWNATVTPAPPPGTTLLVNPLILSSQGTASSVGIPTIATCWVP